MLFVCHTIIDFLCCSCDVMCSQEGDIGIFFLTRVDIYQPPPRLPFTTTTTSPLFLVALSPLPFIFLPRQLSALARCHTGARRSAGGDRCSGSRAEGRKGSWNGGESLKGRREETRWVREGEKHRKRGGRRRLGMGETTESWPSPLCQKGHSAGLGRGQ